MADMHWAIEDHLCKDCGGRILRCVKGGGPTGGGNPIYKCADCGKASSAMGPQVLCWCGFFHKGNYGTTAYMCAPFSILKEHPNLRDAFMSCGSDPSRGEVGILLERDYREEMAKTAAKTGGG